MHLRISAHKIITIVSVGLGIVLLIVILAEPRHARSKDTPATPIASAGRTVAGSQPVSVLLHPAAPAEAPFIVKDTETDSPGTNIVTRIVTFSARVDGTPPPVLQWKVDHGKGYEPLTGATNNVFRIGNAQVYDSGFYSLFATNCAGSIHTAPQQLAVTEGED
jgi:hypothetical protein